MSVQDCVELIAGEIIDIPPVSSQHAGAVKKLSHLFNQAIAPRAILSTHNPIILNNLSEPQPDIALLYYHKIKLPLYAQAAIPEV